MYIYTKFSTIVYLYYTQIDDLKTMKYFSIMTQSITQLCNYLHKNIYFFF